MVPREIAGSGVSVRGEIGLAAQSTQCGWADGVGRPFCEQLSTEGTMHPNHILAISAALLLAGSNGAPRHGSERLPAQVRFSNKMGGNRTWSLQSNAKVLFADVLPNTTTSYVPVTDTAARLTLHREGSDSVLATTNYQFAAGSYYTATATYANGDRPMLSVERDVPPRDTMPAFRRPP
jgi:hypothetical protein